MIVRQKQTVRRTLLAMGVAGLSLVPAAANAAEISLQIGTIESPTGANSLGWQAFEQYVEAASGGDIDVELLHSGQLGDTEKLLEGAMIGINKMVQGDETLTGAYAPMMTWFTPYLFADEVVMKEFFASETFAEINEAMAADLGVRALAASPYGFYNFINKTRPVESLEDLAGLKLRTLPSSEMTIRAWEGLGASATPVSWGEIYTSIQTGVINGLGHTIGIMVDQKYYEVAKNVTLDNSFGVVNFYLVNEAFWQGLDDQQRATLKRGAQIGAATEFGVAAYRNRVEGLQTLEENGVDIRPISDVERERLREAAQESVLPWLKEQVDPALVEKVFAEVKAIEARLNR
ncbi:MULTISPECIES: TRAP transporter substrate-binding protein [Hoeflea]|jgi:TRAP-type C4-dicarboxylate transport system substrate-binding protein|uniref:TRAP transporter substrate-binding protein n=1 Tax=Hoeflea algicola TaxID=2983763 RepID=A0ABT3ZE84_9HYPH|nr:MULTISPECIES: TRAP transporter substrate-binding protein [Hoeflea]MCY0150107.1 TRAP transporter substrate-binding protein [Hoeflea algicola]